MDKLTLIKVGGKIVEEQETLSRLLVAFAAIPEKKVLVHGGGRSATAMASRLGIESRMVGGRRITDKSMLEVDNGLRRFGKQKHCSRITGSGCECFGYDGS